jgi:hypothetical protein
MNSCKHGIRAEKLVLANEPKDWILDLTSKWVEYYQPQSPGRQALLDRAVMATVHHERSKRYLAGTLGEQVRTAERNYDRQQQDVVLHYVELLKTEPSAAVRRLKHSAAGCRWLISEFLLLQNEWIAEGYLVSSRRDHATRILGYRPDDKADAQVYYLWYYTLASRTPRNEAMSELLADRKRMPDTLRNWFRKEGAPTPEESQDQVGTILKRELAALRALEKQLRTEVEEPARAAAGEKAMVLAPDEMALWLRYERMHDAMFHRSYGALERKESAGSELEHGPSAEPDPGPDSVDAAPPPGAIEALVEEAAAASAAGEERDENSEWDSRPVEDPPAAGGPVAAVEAEVERQTKRVATVALEATNVGALASEEPGPADRGGSRFFDKDGEWIEATSDAPGEVETVPATLGDEGVDGSQNEPENRSDDSAQTVEIMVGSVENSAPVRVRTEGDSGGALAGADTAPAVVAEELRGEGTPTTRLPLVAGD